MAGAVMALPQMLAPAMASAAPAIAGGAGAAQGVASAMPAAGELFGSLGQALPSAEGIMAGAPEFGSGAMGPEFAEGEMFGGSQDLMNGLNANDYQAENPTEPQNPDAFPGQGALSHYKDMSNYANMGAISGLMNSQPASKQNRMVTKPEAVNQYLQSLMGG